MTIYKLNCIVKCSHLEYGIDVLHNGELIKSICSITDNKDDMVELKNICNEAKLELCHLENIIEDYLTDFCT